MLTRRSFIAGTASALAYLKSNWAAWPNIAESAVEVTPQTEFPGPEPAELAKGNPWARWMVMPQKGLQPGMLVMAGPDGAVPWDPKSGHMALGFAGRVKGNWATIAIEGRTAFVFTGTEIHTGS